MLYTCATAGYVVLSQAMNPASSSWLLYASQCQPFGRSLLLLLLTWLLLLLLLLLLLPVGDDHGLCLHDADKDKPLPPTYAHRHDHVIGLVRV
jgi:hypothetical protein